MQKVSQILLQFDPIQDKYVTRDFQQFGIYLAEELNDYKHRGLYIKLAKTIHRSVLEKALSFSIDSKVENKGGLFMWKLTQLGVLKPRLKKNQK